MGKYIDKIVFHNLLKDYRDLNIEIDDLKEEIADNKEEIDELSSKSRRVYEKIGKQFLLIATNFMNKPRYINYSDDWKDDMISEAVYDMIRYIHNYDVDLMESYLDRGKTPDPFSYFSQYVRNGAMRYLSERYKDADFLVRLSFIENIDKREISHD